jgi:hypothetical protein
MKKDPYSSSAYLPGDFLQPGQTILGWQTRFRAHLFEQFFAERAGLHQRHLCRWIAVISTIGLRSRRT